MTLHIFNPEHDIALASGLSNFTAPHAGRQLRHDLGFLPTLWAEEGDVILVDDVEQARRVWQKTVFRLKKMGVDRVKHLVKPLFIPCLCPLNNIVIDAVDPWGWNSALCAMLQRRGLDPRLMPDAELLDTVRRLSHRSTAVALLPKLRCQGTVGESFECQTQEQVEALLERYGQLVLKAPWSSSGRGLRFLSAGRTSFSMHAGWFRHVVEAQGCVVAEPFYNKVKDFGMEFRSDGRGHVEYLGLSLFHTANGAYTGNIIATEAVKQQVVTNYIPESLLSDVKAGICRELGEVFKDRYQGPFGVDMMIVGGATFQLHPCVEINLRRTMGHVALEMTPTDDDIRLVMRIEYAENNYQLKISHL